MDAVVVVATAGMRADRAAVPQEGATRRSLRQTVRARFDVCVQARAAAAAVQSALAVEAPGQQCASCVQIRIAGTVPGVAHRSRRWRVRRWGRGGTQHVL